MKHFRLDRKLIIFYVSLTHSLISCYRCVVALEERLDEEAERSNQTYQDENPEKQTVDHHGNIFPVLNDLQIHTICAWLGCC